MHPIWHGQGAYGRALVYFQRCVLSTKITAAASSDPSISTPDPTKFKPLVIPGLTTTEKKRFVLHKAKVRTMWYLSSCHLTGKAGLASATGVQR